MCGTKKICIFDQIMDVSFYVNIVENFLTPFIQEKVPQEHQFMQDSPKAYELACKGVHGGTECELVEAGS